ncbi:MAG: hypothetical protein AAF618_11270 [Pseudomonadota bacterium]
MRILFALVGLVSLAACSPQIPDSGAGVGFGSAEEFRAAQARRDAELEGRLNELPSQADQTAAAVDAVIPGSVADAEAGTEGSETPLVAAAPIDEASGEISDEQNFNAVSDRETIESDAARIAAARQRYQVVQPTALPSRRGGTVNIVQYALSTSNAKGQTIYRRSGLTGQNRHLRNCAAYASADLAQQAFLENGGPERDRRGLDPDGDGFACAWDPAPFRVVGG